MSRLTGSTTRTSRGRAGGRLGELEQATMQVLWNRSDATGATVRQVHEELSGTREIAYTTVLTVLDRMAGKGLVTREKQGRAFAYRAADSRDAMTAELMRDALAELATVDRSEALVAFVQDATESDREALRAALRALDGS